MATCLATELLSYVSAATAAQYGVTIMAEAVPEGEHALILILQATHREQAERFMAYFQRFGSVHVQQAWSSEAAIARGGCIPTPQRHAALLRDVPEPGSIGAAAGHNTGLHSRSGVDSGDD